MGSSKMEASMAKVLASLVMVLVMCKGDHKPSLSTAFHRPKGAYKPPSTTMHTPTTTEACAVHHVTVWEQECSTHYRYECTEGRSKRSILKLIKLLIGKAKKKEKKCDAVPVRNCSKVSKVKPVVKCKQH